MPVADCPSCSTRLRVPDGRSGKAKCPKCGGGVTLAPLAPLAPAATVEALPDVEVEEPAAPAAACPYCRAEDRPGARKCKHCGETLDPALRAAQEAERAARRSPRPHDRDDVRAAAPPARRRSLAGGCLTLLAIVGVLAGVGVLVMKYQQRGDLNEGTRLWDTGRRDAAVAKYKAGFPAAGAEKPGVVRRIVEHELARGDSKEAAAWVEKGLAEGLDVPYAEPAAVALLDQTRRDRADREAKAQAERAARAKQKDEEAAKGKTERDVKDRRYTRDEFRSLVVGKDREEVLGLLGKPRSTQESGPLEFWDYPGRTTDPTTGKTDQGVQVEFENGTVSGVTFTRL